jgi:hypothetical protein
MYVYIYIRRLCLLSALLLMHNPHDTYKSRDFVYAWNAHENISMLYAVLHVYVYILWTIDTC